jgi:hypothetical protein
MHAKLEVKRPIVRPRRRWEDNIRMYLTEIVGRCGLDASGSAWKPVGGSCEHGNEPLNSIKGKEFLD